MVIQRELLRGGDVTDRGLLVVVTSEVNFLGCARHSQQTVAQTTERYFTIVKLSDFGAERTPAELVAVITSV